MGNVPELVASKLVDNLVSLLLGSLLPGACRMGMRASKRLIRRFKYPRGRGIVKSSSFSIAVGGSEVPWCTIDGSPHTRYRPENIHTFYDPDPVALPDDVTRNKEEVSREDQARPSTTWNGLRYCLKGFQLLRETDDEIPGLRLYFGPSDYDTFRATSPRLDHRSSATAATLRERYLAAWNPLDQPCPFLANSFGINLLPITRDGYAVLARRSTALLVRPSQYSVAVSEGLMRPTDRRIESEAPDIFKAALRGMKEEIGVGAREEEIHLTSFGVDVEAYQYAMLGFVRLGLSSDEVVERHSLEAKDRFEHSALEFVPITPKDLADYVANHQPWSPAGIACLVTGLHAAAHAGIIGVSPDELRSAFRQVNLHIHASGVERSVVFSG